MPRKGAITDLVGQRFGRLVVVRFSHQTKHRRSMWWCLCDCGWSIAIDGGNLRGGNTESCGCLRSEVTAATSTTHGHAAGAGTAEYESWCAMLARVRATTGRRARDYANRGISVCPRWESFENFLADMGSRPAGTTLDRIDNDGNYEPGNCRWATASQQNSNKRRHAAQ
jgi:hypothetical protein